MSSEPVSIVNFLPFNFFHFLIVSYGEECQLSATRNFFQNGKQTINQRLQLYNVKILYKTIYLGRATNLILKHTDF